MRLSPNAIVVEENFLVVVPDQNLSPLKYIPIFSIVRIIWCNLFLLHQDYCNIFNGDQNDVAGALSFVHEINLKLLLLK